MPGSSGIILKTFVDLKILIITFEKLHIEEYIRCYYWVYIYLKNKCEDGTQKISSKGPTEKKTKNRSVWALGVINQICDFWFTGALSAMHYSTS